MNVWHIAFTGHRDNDAAAIVFAPDEKAAREIFADVIRNHRFENPSIWQVRKLNEQHKGFVLVDGDY